MNRSDSFERRKCHVSATARQWQLQFDLQLTLGTWPLPGWCAPLEVGAGHRTIISDSPTANHLAHFREVDFTALRSMTAGNAVRSLGQRLEISVRHENRSPSVRGRLKVSGHISGGARLHSIHWCSCSLTHRCNKSTRSVCIDTRWPRARASASRRWARLYRASGGAPVVRGGPLHDVESSCL
jgi:hypothetical protein